MASYDLVLISSSNLFCNLVSVAKSTPVVTYLHSLPRNIFGIDPPYALQRVLPYAALLVPRYKKALQNTRYVLTNSHHTQSLVKQALGISSTIIYPPVQIPHHFPIRRKPAYFLCVSRLDQVKNLEIAIVACTHLGLPLKIVGRAPDPIYWQYLRSLAGPTVEFLGFRSDQEISNLYPQATAFIFPTKNEDFGIAPVEAMAHGVPVIAYWGGGIKETVVAGQTGIFFYQHTPHALMQILRQFRRDAFSPRLLYQHAQQFSEVRFKREMKNYLAKVFAKEQEGKRKHPHNR